MAGHTSARCERVYAVEQRYALRLTLHAVASVEVDHIPLAEGQIQTHRARLAQPDDLIACVDDLGGSGNNIKLLEHAVIQFNFDIGRFIDKGYDQRLHRIAVIIDGWQTGDGVLAVKYIVRGVAKLCAAAAVGARRADACDSEIAHAEGGVFLRHRVERVGTIVSHFVGVAGEPVIVDAEWIGHIVLTELFTVV